MEGGGGRHEEDAGLLWKHVDWRTGSTSSRRARRLSVSFICTIANYEYGFYMYLGMDGTLQFEVKLTGILSTGATQPLEPRKWGVPLTPDGLCAPPNPPPSLRPPAPPTPQSLRSCQCGQGGRRGYQGVCQWSVLW